MLRLAIASRPLTGARDVARVVDSRVRRMIEHTAPKVPGSWAQRVPQMGDPDLDRFMQDLAEAMDDRVRRIGEHAVDTKPAWATRALGDVPDDPVRRAEWQERAAKLGAYRELYGYDASGDAIGPEPGKASPEARADWHAAFAVLGRVGGIDMRRFSDSKLRQLRGTYEQETNWAPPYVGEELRLARLQARAAWENTVRAEHEARAAVSPEFAGRHRLLAGMWRAIHAKATRVADLLAEAHETRRQWETFTEPTRRVAVAADLELRRRHPGMTLKPLKSAEPAGIMGPQPEPVPSPAPHPQFWIQETLDGAGHLPNAGTGQLTEPGRDVPLTPARREAAGQQALGLTPETVSEEIPAQVLRIRDNVRSAQQKIDCYRGTPEFAADGELAYLGPAWGVLNRRDRDAILQPPQPAVIPAREIAQRAADRSAAREPEHA